ncbi:MAG: helicase/exodeoxyribonuclease subunit, partial [Gammaproteobacteria bacterium]|nr:helicase/exodeoxyribonuclease subunit [Gammaproteobacteria bacterium]
RYPIIDTALLILGLGTQPAALEDFGSLLRSPFIKDYEKESQQRAKLDAVLRKYGEYRVTLKSLRWLIASKRIKANDVPQSFINCCEHYQHTFQVAEKKQSASDWAKTFTNLLQSFGWPGERSLNSAEYQTVAEWQKLLSQLAALEVVSSSMNCNEALAQLRQLLMNTGFQPETAEVPIQILRMTGTAGMQFDHLRVMGLHAEGWPPKAEPDPFIPLKLQRGLGIPDASAEIKLRQSENLFQRLINSSPDVVLSYPQNERDRPLRPSPLIKNYLEATPTQLQDDARDYAALLYHAGEQEVIDDSRAPIIAAGQTVSGGTALFKDQAACPFRAFARHRLYAEGLDTKDIGLNAMDRGSIMHDVMEKFWKRLGSQAALLAISEKDLNTLIRQVVTGTITGYQKQFPLTFTERFTRLESDRLETVTRQLLDIERVRAPFTVKNCEYWHVFTFNDITIRTRIDRIDQLTDGRAVIMDYKTGDPKINHWFSDRPDDPQLPLYVITSEGEIAAIVFTRLKRGEVAYVGLAQEDNILPDVKTVTNTKSVKDIPDWPSLMTQWQATLNQLAVSFRQGNAIVDPKSSDSCKHCDLHALCRIFEKNSGYSNQESDYE